MRNNARVTQPLVLSFDLDDTLWPVTPLLSAAEEELWAWLAETHPQTMRAHTRDSLRALRAAVAAAHPQHSHDLTFLRLRALERLFAGAAQRDAMAAQAFEIFYAARNRVELYEDVMHELPRLQRRYRLFALSNGNADLARCGVADLFEGHVSAISAGAAKPDARIFEALVRAAAVPRERIMHIGDDPRTDVDGARRAGLQAVWLNRERRQWPDDLPAPPRTITTLREID